MKALPFCSVLFALITSNLAAAQGQALTFSSQSLTPEAALTVALAALKECRKQGTQISVAVSDRQGNTLVVLRDRNAGLHTLDTAMNKAWTAASFKVSTAGFGNETQAGKIMSGIRNLPKVMAVGGGLPISAPSGFVGAIGVSGAPSGALDEDCAKAGITAIEEALLFSQ